MQVGSIAGKRPKLVKVPTSTKARIEFSNFTSCQLRIESDAQKIIDGQVSTEHLIMPEKGFCASSRLHLRPLSFSSLQCSDVKSPIDRTIVQAYFRRLLRFSASTLVDSEGDLTMESGNE